MSLRFLAAGPLTTVQDAGRFGYQALGFPPSGAADPYALKLGNILVGNNVGEAALEMTARGSTVQFTQPCVAALTGADCTPFLNGRQIPMNTAFCVDQGDYLHCSYMLDGFRSYLCVHGGMQIPEFLGSKSTFLKLSVGGFEGRKIKQGDEIELKDPAHTLKNMEKRVIPEKLLPRSNVLKVVPGPQQEFFAREELQKFFSSVYTVTPASDRMGIRLEGPPLNAAGGTDIVSDGIVTGAIQVPNNGEPIILLNDRQTTGGYAKIATVAACSLSDAAQLMPGKGVSFRKISVDEAESISRYAEKLFAALNQKLNA